MSDLFEVPVSLSPRLRWLDRHALTLRKLESGKWECALDELTFGRGETEEEACADFCVKTRLAHWSLL